MAQFNLRVYGILKHEGRVLVSDEYIKGMEITKFPGGGLEYGEGTIDGLKREFKEELNLEIEITGHFYTTDFFVNSAFTKSNNQLISIYYLVSNASPLNFTTSDKPFDYPKKKDGAQSFRWIDLKTISEKDFTFIIDKHVGEMLNARLY